MTRVNRLSGRRWMSRVAGVAACALALAPLSGCLLKDVSETWYVDNSGAVIWVVQESNVRSDANAAIDRLNEESIYWLAVQQERHPMAAGLRELGGSKIRTLVLRGEVPYTVRTEGRFNGLDELGQRMIAAIGATGTSIVTREGLSWEWTMVVRDPAAAGTTGEPSESVEALLNDLDKLQVVLVNGRFESAEGFSLSSDKRTAVMQSREATRNTSEEPAVTLTLKWKGGA